MSSTVLLGLDGATFSILDPLMERGQMPHLKALVERGFKAPLLSTPNPLTPPAWTSMITGRGPGSHGVFDFVRWEERTGTIYFTLYNSTDIRCETIWSMASRKGFRVTHLNFPVMAPPEPINGFVIPSMLQWRHLKRNIHPQSLFETLKSIPGFNPEQWGLTYWEANEAMRERALVPKEENEYMSRHIRRDYQWFLILRHLMQETPSELTAIVFDGVDKLQHLCWRMIDPHLEQDLSLDWEQRTRQLALDYFLKVDGYIRDVAAMAGADANVFIVSDHGFGPTRYIFHVNALLEELGYLYWRDQSNERAKKSNHEWSFASLDLARTRAYAGTPSSNGICIRAPGDFGWRAREDYLAFQDKLSRQLLEYRDPQTGEQIVTRIQTREEAYSGPAVEKAPDLLLTLSDHGFVSVVNERPVVLHRPKINGTHRPHGVFMAAGPAIKEGVEGEPISILDVAPCVLYSLGIALPRDLEGRLPEEAFRAEYLNTHPVLRDTAKGTAHDRANAAISPYSNAEEEAIMSQLRGLGYVE